MFQEISFRVTRAKGTGKGVPTKSKPSPEPTSPTKKLKLRAAESAIDEVSAYDGEEEVKTEEDMDAGLAEAYRPHCDYNIECGGEMAPLTSIACSKTYELPREASSCPITVDRSAPFELCRMIMFESYISVALVYKLPFYPYTYVVGYA